MKRNRVASLIIIAVTMVLFVIYDYAFVTAYNRMCLSIGASETLIPLYKVFLFTIIAVLPIFLSRSIITFVFQWILTTAEILLICYSLIVLTVYGADIFGECFTFMGDHGDQTLLLVGIIGCTYAATCLCYLSLMLEFFAFVTKMLVRRVRNDQSVNGARNKR